MQIAAVSTWQVVLIYIFIDVPVYCAMFLCVYMCGISNQITTKKPRYVSHLNKLDFLFSYKTHSKILLVWKYQDSTCCRSIVSLSKITHQMWSDHPFSHRSNTSKITAKVNVRGEVEGDRETGLDKMYKRWFRQYQGVFITYRVLGTHHQLWAIKSCSGQRVFW